MKISEMKEVIKVSADAHIEAALWRTRKKFGEINEETVANYGKGKTLEEIMLLTEQFKPFSINLIGEGGIGKTEGVYTSGTEKKIPVYVFNPSQWADNSDIIGMPLKEKVDGRWRTINALPEFFPDYVYDEETGKPKRREDGGLMVNYAANNKYIKNYEEINNYYLNKFPDKYKDNPHEAINEAPGAIIFFDELNRVIAQDVIQAMFQIFIEQRLMNYTFPEGVILISASNPSTTEYSTSPIFEERAFKDRFIHLFVTNDLADFNAYASENKFHSSILSHVNEYADALMVAGKDYDLEIIPSPRSWRFVNTIVAFTELPKLKRDVVVEIFSGVIGLEQATKFMDTLEKGGEKLPSGEEIVMEYEKVREKIQKAVDTNRQDYIIEVKRRFLELVQEENFAEKYRVQQPTDEDGNFIIEAGDAKKLGLDLRPYREDETKVLITPDEAIALELTKEQLEKLDLVMIKNANDENIFIKKNLQNVYEFISDLPADVAVVTIKEMITTTKNVLSVFAKHQQLFELIQRYVRESEAQAEEQVG